MTSVSMIPSSTTPLLGTKPPTRTALKRVPTFMQTSILHSYGNVLFHLLLEVILPICLYYIFRIFLPPVLSLLLASLPALLIVALEGFRHHKVDMPGALILIGFLISAVLAMIPAGPKLYLLRESTMTLTMGIILLATVLPLRIGQHKLRPFMFYVARQMAVSGSITYSIDNGIIVQQHWDGFWDLWTIFRVFFRLLTAIWALGFISEFLVRMVLLRSLDDVDDVIYYSNLYMLVVLVILGIMTVTSVLLLRHLYNQEQTKLKDAEHQAEIERIIQAAANENRNQDGATIIGSHQSPGSTSAI